jgi:hypothetical protein
MVAGRIRRLGAVRVSSCYFVDRLSAREKAIHEVTRNDTKPLKRLVTLRWADVHRAEAAVLMRTLRVSTRPAGLHDFQDRARQIESAVVAVVSHQIKRLLSIGRQTNADKNTPSEPVWSRVTAFHDGRALLR